MGEIDFGALSYGAANVGNLYRPLTDEQALQILQAAWDAGIRSFDTAPHYGLGLSERRLGAFLATKPRDEYILSTKVGRLLRPNPDGEGTLDLAEDFAVPADLKRVWDFSPAGIRRSLDESLERLGVESVDVLYLHDPEKNPIANAVEVGVASLAAVREEGLVAAIGVGSMSTEALLAAVRTDDLDLLMIAGRHTLVDHAGSAQILPECRTRSVDVVNAAVFNSGLLASNSPGAKARYNYGAVPDELLTCARRIAEVCAGYGVELPAAALQFSLRDPIVRTVVAGGGTPEQVRENAERMRVEIPDDLWRELDAAGLVPA